MSHSFLITIGVVLFSNFSVGAEEVVWQLQLKDGAPTNCTLALTRVAPDQNGQPVLEADSRGSQSEWHSCVTLPKGLLKAGTDYVVKLDYEVIDRLPPNSYFYIFGRSQQLGLGSDHWQIWHGEPGGQGTAKLRLSPTTDDVVINVGICHQGAMRIRNLEVLLGSGWTTLPLTATFGNEPPLPTPSGAKPFIVNPPADSNGPVLNLTDFGAVADGEVPPAPGTDRNLVAFKAAIAKCHELKASKLVVPKGVYRLTSGETIVFAGLNDFTFDGGGSTFLFDQIKGGAGMAIKNCQRTVFRNFNLDWDWKIDPLASVGRIVAVAPKSASFDIRFETAPPMDLKRWVTMNPLDETLRVPGPGKEFGNFGPKNIEPLDAQTVRVTPTWPVPAKAGQLYLLRHYTYEKHALVMNSNAHLSLQEITIYSFPGIGFVVSGDQHHFELLHCRITYPENESRPITTTADGLYVAQSQGCIRLENCDFGYMGDDCVNIHDNVHSGIQRVDDHTLLVTNLVSWTSPYSAGDMVEIRNADYSPTGFTGQLSATTTIYNSKSVMLVFDQVLPTHLASDAILFNHRYNSHNCLIRNCYFHENRACGLLGNTADWLIEGNRFFHNQHSAMLLLAEVGPNWSEGFGAQNVIVRENRFESANSMGTGNGAVVSLGAKIYGETTHYPLLEQILFENNAFIGTAGPIIEATSFKDLVIRQNIIINLDPSPLKKKMRGAICTELGSELRVEGNAWTTQNSPESAALFYDPETTQKIVWQTNSLKN